METEELWVDEADLTNPKDDMLLNKYVQPNKWEWDVFGNGDVIFAIPNDVSIWKRFWMGICFRSKFKKL